jgi:transcription initiation factor TFIID subunit 2
MVVPRQSFDVGWRMHILTQSFSYFDEIKRPMDLGTMQTKLSQGRYATMESFAADYHLMIQNCRVFNPPKTFPTDCADALDRVFDKEWAKVHEKRLNFAEKRSLQAVLGKLVADPLCVIIGSVGRFTQCADRVHSSWVFREPVDPVALGIPMYHEIIPKKDARDLRTIRTKLDNDRYDTVDALEADIELMVSNAVKFNGAESEVGQLALQLRSKAREALATVNPTRKRKDGGSTPQPGSKKVKLI